MWGVCEYDCTVLVSAFLCLDLDTFSVQRQALGPLPTCFSFCKWTALPKWLMLGHVHLVHNDKPLGLYPFILKIYSITKMVDVRACGMLGHGKQTCKSSQGLSARVTRNEMDYFSNLSAILLILLLLLLLPIFLFFFFLLNVCPYISFWVYLCRNVWFFQQQDQQIFFADNAWNHVYFGKRQSACCCVQNEGCLSQFVVLKVSIAILPMEMLKAFSSVKVNSDLRSLTISAPAEGGKWR